MGVKFTFTPWGFVSGVFMVPGGWAGYFAVQNSGMAVSQGIWSCLKVLVSFCWGILIFHEPVRSTLGATYAVLLMMLGLAGMSYFASGPSSSDRLEEQPLLPEESDQDPETASGSNSDEQSSFLCCSSQRRHIGLVGAIVDGAYGGSVLVPMHYAGAEHTEGLHYVISFGIGCATVVSLVWLLRFVVYSVEAKSVTRGWERLPSFHWTTVGPYAALAGLIWNVGNVSSIVSVAMLGEGVGYSIVQSQLLVAGLWGTFFYREIKGRTVIIQWFLFAFVTVAGILLLSREHSSLHTMGHN
jgi:hypothetical protein